jgi:hypothetical protein
MEGKMDVEYIKNLLKVIESLSRNGCDALENGDNFRCKNCIDMIESDVAEIREELRHLHVTTTEK